MESPIETPSTIDYAGAGILAALLISFLVAMSEGESWGWTSGRTLGLFGVAVVLLPVWVMVELRQRQPLVDVRMLVHGRVLIANLTALLAGFALYAAFVGVPQFVQTPSSALPDEVRQLVGRAVAGAAGAQLEVVHDAAHALPYDDPGTFAGLIAAFVERVGHDR